MVCLSYVWIMGEKDNLKKMTKLFTAVCDIFIYRYFKRMSYSAYEKVILCIYQQLICQKRGRRRITNSILSKANCFHPFISQEPSYQIYTKAFKIRTSSKNHNCIMLWRVCKRLISSSNKHFIFAGCSKMRA